MNLVVKHAFADYKVGDQITDPATVAEILASEQQHNVIKTAPAAVADDAPPKAPKK